ncbi:MAG: hypothetical protein ABFD81_18080 [Syntrophaceae bacterium]
MTDYAAPIAITRPRTRIMDRIVTMAHKVSPWFAVLALGFVIGMAQGAMQSDRHWKDKIVTRSHVDPSGEPLAVYEDGLGNVYYSRMERRNQ